MAMFDSRCPESSPSSSPLLDCGSDSYFPGTELLGFFDSQTPFPDATLPEKKYGSREFPIDLDPLPPESISIVGGSSEMVYAASGTVTTDFASSVVVFGGQLATNSTESEPIQFDDDYARLFPTSGFERCPLLRQYFMDLYLLYVPSSRALLRSHSTAPNEVDRPLGDSK